MHSKKTRSKELLVRHSREASISFVSSSLSLSLSLQLHFTEMQQTSSSLRIFVVCYSSENTHAQGS